MKEGCAFRDGGIMEADSRDLELLGQLFGMRELVALDWFGHEDGENSEGGQGGYQGRAHGGGVGRWGGSVNVRGRIDWLLVGRPSRSG